MERIAPPTRVLWQRLDLPGIEWCEIRWAAQPARLSGVALVAEGAGAHRIEYAIELDERFRTRRVSITARGAVEASLDLISDGAGTWRSGDGAVVIDATDDPAAVDVDLGFSPLTNSLPIWRLGPGIDVGETAEIRVAWVLYPSLEVVEGQQSYTRVGERRWQYRSTGYQAEIEVGEDGLVEDYADAWRAVGRSG